LRAFGAGRSSTARPARFEVRAPGSLHCGRVHAAEGRAAAEEVLNPRCAAALRAVGYAKDTPEPLVDPSAILILVERAILMGSATD